MIILILTIGCSKSTTEPSGFDIQDLYKTWIHSFEEQNNYTQHIYRPINYKEFPASWFRLKYIFEPDSTCQWLVLADNDAHYLQFGTWEITSNNELTMLIYDSTGTLQEYVSFKIIDLQQDLLEMTPID